MAKTEDLRFRTPHKAGGFHWYEEDWGISIYLTNDSKNNCGIRWCVLKAAMRRAAKALAEALKPSHNTGSPKLFDDMESFAVACDRAGNGRDARKVRAWVKQLRAGA